MIIVCESRFPPFGGNDPLQKNLTGENCLFGVEVDKGLKPLVCCLLTLTPCESLSLSQRWENDGELWGLNKITQGEGC